MKIKTNSIIQEFTGKSFYGENNITKNDLLTIKKLKIDSIDEIDKMPLNIDYDELKYLKNLEDLSIYNSTIDNKCVNTILSLENITNLCFHNCDFSISNDEIFTNRKIKILTITSCNNIDKHRVSNKNYFKLVGNSPFIISNIKELNLKFYEGDINKLNIKDIDNVLK